MPIIDVTRTRLRLRLARIHSTYFDEIQVGQISHALTGRTYRDYRRQVDDVIRAHLKHLADFTRDYGIDWTPAPEGIRARAR